MKIDLSQYNFVKPTSIKTIKKPKIMYDITVDGDNTFFVKINNNIMLMHNCDGHHISSLLINFFYKWFPNVVEEGRLLKLITPLVSCDYKNKRKYFYSIEEYNKFAKDNKLLNVNYLKGLGSLSMQDWEHVMTNKNMFQILIDKSSEKFLDIAFGASSEKRKDWLSQKAV
jgi:DNA gyrase/topoisomerase IV subunit B